MSKASNTERISLTASRHKHLSQRLIKAVQRAQTMAYAPYSKISVGAGLYCGGRKIYTGANVENSSYSLSMCAERIALFQAVSEGVRDFRLLLVYSPQVSFITPCGACLQVLSEFAPDLVIASMNKREQFRFYPISVLMPQPFRLSQE